MNLVTELAAKEYNCGKKLNACRHVAFFSSSPQRASYLCLECTMFDRALSLSAMVTPQRTLMMEGWTMPTTKCMSVGTSSLSFFLTLSFSYPTSSPFSLSLFCASLFLTLSSFCLSLSLCAPPPLPPSNSVFFLFVHVSVCPAICLSDSAYLLSGQVSIIY